MRQLRVMMITVAVALLVGCELFPPDQGIVQDNGNGDAGIGAAGDLEGAFDVLAVDWSVSHFSEAVCSGGTSLVAGSSYALQGEISGLDDVSLHASVAWDWSVPAAGLFTPTGPRASNGASATIVGDYPYDFAVDPFAALDPFTPVCAERVSATGVVTLTDDEGDQLTGVVTGGEVYELAFGSFPGDGQEQFLEVMISSGTGEQFGAAGFFVLHSIIDFTGPGLVRSEILPGGEITHDDCERVSGTLDAFAFDWVVSHFSEQICSGGTSQVAGGAYRLHAEVEPLDDAEAEVSVAWDWSVPAPGRYAPEGPGGGASASASVVISYPYDFAVNPFATSNPLAPVCGSTVSASGAFVLRGEDDDDEVHGTVTGGEVYELRYNLWGDGLEQFLEITIDGGAGRYEDASGEFVVHSLFRFDATGLGLVRSEILPGGAICQSD